MAITTLDGVIAGMQAPQPFMKVEVTAANIGNAIDALTSGFPQLFDDTTLQLVWFPTATTATTISGQYIETQG